MQSERRKSVDSRPTYANDCPCIDPCPMTLMFEIIGGKWKTKIICTLNLNETLRDGDIKRRVRGIAPTMLASSLKDLEQLGIVSRVQYDEMPVRVEYQLTEAGRSLVPILIAMRDWGAAYGEQLARSDAAQEGERANGRPLRKENE